MEVLIRNFKSVREARIRLGRVTVLLGLPLAGKSNILEATALATYFDQYAYYGALEPLHKLLRAAEVSDLFTFYDITKAIEININAREWGRSLRIYFHGGPRIELDGIELPLRQTIGGTYCLFKHGTYWYALYPHEFVNKLSGLKGRVLARLYGFDRFRDDVPSSIVKGFETDVPREILREDGKNIGIVAKRQPEAIRDLNAELSELGPVDVKLLEDGRFAIFDNDIAMRPYAAPDSIYRILYNLIGLSSAAFFTKFFGLEERVLVLLEEPEGQIFPQFFNLLVKYIVKFSEVGRVVITTHKPILVSLLRDKLDVTLYYVYRGSGGLTEVAELDKDRLTEELVTSEDILFMRPREVLRLCRCAS
ncbi:MAG: ATP-binding protein [Thermoproteaceae archaeon]|nr:ATP-binding protein [Thermoproteaceae archaeon]